VSAGSFFYFAGEVHRSSPRSKIVNVGVEVVLPVKIKIATVALQLSGGFYPNNVMSMTT
jgi:hypothetical protein